MKSNKSLVWKISSWFRLLLASLMLLGNPSIWLGLAFSTPLRIGLMAFAGTMLATARSWARPARNNGVPNVHPQIIKMDLSGLGDDPTDSQLAQVQLFTTPFIPTSAAPLEGENSALAKALKETFNDPSDEDYSHMEGFVHNFPNSRWVLSVELNRGLLLYENGYFKICVDAYQMAWEAGKDEKPSDLGNNVVSAKGLADRALAELIRMDCRVGRKKETQKLVDQMGTRAPEGLAARYYENATEAMWMMKNRPGRSFVCGPYALKKILEFQHSPRAEDPLIRGYQSTDHGVSLDNVWRLSQELGMNLQIAKRKPGAQVITPAVVNWKLGHYAALVETRKPLNGSSGLAIHSQDPTFGNDVWLSDKALDEEASGYFLVPEGALPEGWEKVTLEEASKIWGQGYTGTIPPQIPPCDAKSFCPSCSGGHCAVHPGKKPASKKSEAAHMPQTDLDLTDLAAMMVDTPLDYDPQVGPYMAFTLTYHQKTSGGLPFSNFGPNWSFNWQSYVHYFVNTTGGTSDYGVASAGGGIEGFTPVTAITLPSANPSTVPAGFTQFSQTQLYPGGYFDATTGTFVGNPSAFVRQFADGWQEIYERTIMLKDDVYVLLTQVVDPQGNVVTINYDDANRISSITDALGRQTNFSYTSSSAWATPLSYSPGYQISKITDPYGRTAVFNYTNGELNSITDSIGMTSSFTYVPGSGPSYGIQNFNGDWVSTMTTPYGTTHFYYGATDFVFNREVEMVDPDGSKQVAKFQLDQTIPETFSSMPSNGTFVSGELNYVDILNTFYWDRKAMADAPRSLSSATVYHWLYQNDSQSFVLASVKRPLEAREWYQYGAQNSVTFSAIQDGSLNSTFPEPIAVGRILTDANGNQTQQFTQYSYNSYGNITSMTDPKGRVTNYSYAPSGPGAGIDLLSITESGKTLASYGTYTNHLPSSYTDAAGKTWNLSYNGFGQLTNVTAPGGEATNYQYDSDGFLVSITPPQLGAGVTFTPDALERVASQSDAINGTINYTYDNGDRVLSASYLDGSSETYSYNNLDLVSYTDRNTPGRTTTYAYDQEDRLKTVTDPKGQITHFNWCTCGSLSSIQDPNGNLTSFTRDVEGRVIQKSCADGSSYGYQYEPSGTRIAQVTDPKGQVTHYGYDIDDAPATITYSNTAVATAGVTLTYDSNFSRITSITDGTGTTNYYYYPIGSTGGGGVSIISMPVVSSGTAGVTYIYDNDGRVTNRYINSISDSYGYSNGELTMLGNSQAASFTLGYDSSSGRLTSVTYPNGESVTYGYYTPSMGSGRLKTITNLASGSATMSYFNYVYDSSGAVTQWIKQLGVSTSSAVTNNFGYDSDSELQAVTQTFHSGATSQTSSFSYDAGGNRTLEQLIIGSSGSPQVGSFTHNFGTPNNLNQLTGETVSPLVVKGYTSSAVTLTVNGASVTEDASNNFNTTLTPSGGSSTPLTIQATGANGASSSQKNHILNTAPFVYDPDGNLIKDGEKTYTWDAANRLISVAYINPQPTGVADTIKMAYDGLGRRVGITELHGAATITGESFVWDGVEMCQQRDSSGVTIQKAYFPLGEWVASGSHSYYFMEDHLGSVVQMSDSGGTSIRAQYDYDSYGRQTKQAGDLDADFGYTGMFQEKAVGLNLTLFRAFDVEKGRWLNRDSLQESVGLNMYAYIGNNSVNGFDPLGLEGCGGNNPISVPLDPNNLENPIPVPGSPGNTWVPSKPSGTGDLNNSWAPKNSLPDQSQPRLNWRPPQGTNPDYFKSSDGFGNNQRYNNKGEPISPDAAHPNIPPEGPAWWWKIPVGILDLLLDIITKAPLIGPIGPLENGSACHINRSAWKRLKNEKMAGDLHRGIRRKLTLVSKKITPVSDFERKY